MIYLGNQGVGLISENGGALYHIFDIVAKIPLTEAATSLTIPFDGAGAYFIVPHPIVTAEEALASGYSYVLSAGGFTYAETSSTVIADTSSTFNSSGLLGYWTGSTAWDSSHQNIIYRGNSNGTVYMLGGREYYVLKPKH